jgi:hypothetical protein
MQGKALFVNNVDPELHKAVLRKCVDMDTNVSEVGRTLFALWISGQIVLRKQEALAFEMITPGGQNTK